MKKIIALLSCAALLITFTGCSEKENMPENTDISGESQNGSSIMQDIDESVASVEGSIKTECETGKDTSNTSTYTGYDPLPEIDLISKANSDSKNLSNEKIGYSYGVSKNGVPHENSVNAQKELEKYGGLALDTKSSEKVLYLTFDCGYENGYTSKVLDALKEKGVPAAFFVTLTYIKSSPDLITRMIKEGHIVGNHSNTHPCFADISREKMAQEIQDVDNYLRTKFGYSSPFFRFPEGAYSENALDLVNTLGYRSIFWSVAYVDWDPNTIRGKDYTIDTLMSRIHPGAVILLHSVSPDNAAAMGEFIDKARAEGYTFKSLSEAKF